MDTKERDNLTMSLAVDLLSMAETIARLNGLEPKDATAALWLAIGALSGSHNPPNKTADQSFAAVLFAGKPLFKVGFEIGKKARG